MEPVVARKEKDHSFAFPDGGWECFACSNYNFKGRTKCFRCKKPMGTEDKGGRPEHMFLEGDAKKAILAVEKEKKKEAKEEI